MSEIRSWTIRDAAETYNVNAWGAGYFRINEAGHIQVTPDGNRVRMFEHPSGRLLLTHREEAALREAAEEKIARLRAELDRLRKSGPLP